MDRDPLSLHAVRETRRFTHETRAVGARADRDEQPVLRFPHGRDGALLAIRPHLSVHAVRRAAEREFAERDDVPLPEEVMRGACRDIREIDLPFVQPLQEFVRRNIDKPHFPGFIKNPVRHGLADRDPGDAGHHVIQALEMLDIKRGVYIDPGFEQLLHILPALRVAAPGEIGVRELIHHEELRVALVTTHLPLKAISEAITPELLREIITILDHDLRTKFGIAQPHVLVCGLNPHAGEGGHMGTEEIDTIIPVLEEMRAKGMNLSGPLPADTLFQPKYLDHADAVLAMYHDQGLPVLKYQGFGRGVNITLGLPFIRTSVDHGTALELAGQGKADVGSFITALNLAIKMIVNTQ